LKPAKAVQGARPVTATAIDREELRRQVLGFGFDVARFAAARVPEKTRQEFRSFLAGDMTWLSNTADRRADPRTLWPEARTAIMVGLNYGPTEDPRHEPRGGGAATISVYARNRDYHDTLKKKLRRLASWIASTHGGKVKIFVDTAPILEKPLAQESGVGWQGKHTNLVSTEFGSWLFLGEILTTLDIAPDEPGADHCGTCRQCLDVCPTAAFIGPYRLDARKCISYLTIEHKGHIPRDLRAAIGNRIYGCDDCLAVCPWNKYARATSEPDFLPRASLRAPTLAALVDLDDPAFRAMFARSPIKRIGRDRFVRNVLIAIGNSATHGLAPSAARRLGDDSPLVRAAAVWALRSLLMARDFATMRADHLDREDDPAVRAEWSA
jgi:epoxyqueuosine reductase